MNLLIVVIVSILGLSACGQIQGYGTIPLKQVHDLEEVKSNPEEAAPLIEDENVCLPRAYHPKLAGVVIGSITNIFAIIWGARAIYAASQCGGENNCPDSDRFRDSAVVALAWTGAIAEIVCASLSAHFENRLEFVTKFGIGYLAVKLILLTVSTGLLSYNSLDSLMIVVILLSIEIALPIGLFVCGAYCGICIVGTVLGEVLSKIISQLWDIGN